MSEKEMSKSTIESVWDDIVEENPARRGLEICLGSTVIGTVVMIIGLAVFVFFSLEEAPQVQLGQLPMHTYVINVGTAKEFARRLLGWIDFSQKPCEDFYAYACGGFMHQSYPEAMVFTPEKAAEYDLAQELNEAFERRDTTNDDNTMKTGVGLYQMCMQGLNSTDRLKAQLTITIFNKKINNRQFPGGFVGVQESSLVNDVTILIPTLFWIFPVLRLEYRDQEMLVFEPDLTGGRMLYKDSTFRRDYIRAFSALGSQYGLRYQDDGQFAFNVEKALAEASSNPDDRVPLGGAQGVTPMSLARIKTTFPLADYLMELADFSGDSVLFADPNVGKILKAFDALKSAKDKAALMNYMIFRVMIHLGPLYNENDKKDIDAFISFISKWVYYTKEMPPGEQICARFLERYLQPVFFKILNEHEDKKMEIEEAASSVRYFYDLSDGLLFQVPKDVKDPVPIIQLFLTSMVSTLKGSSKNKTLAAYMTTFSDASLELHYFYPNDTNFYTTRTANWDLDPQVLNTAGGFLAALIKISEGIRKVFSTLKGQDNAWKGSMFDSTPFIDHYSHKNKAPTKVHLYIQYILSREPFYSPYNGFKPDMFPVFGFKISTAFLRLLQYRTAERRFNLLSPYKDSLNCYKENLEGSADTKDVGLMAAEHSGAQMTKNLFFLYQGQRTAPEYDYRLADLSHFSGLETFLITWAQALCEKEDSSFPKGARGQRSPQDRVNKILWNWPVMRERVAATVNKFPFTCSPRRQFMKNLAGGSFCKLSLGG